MSDPGQYRDKPASSAGAPNPLDAARSTLNRLTDAVRDGVRPPERTDRPAPSGTVGAVQTPPSSPAVAPHRQGAPIAYENPTTQLPAAGWNPSPAPAPAAAASRRTRKARLRIARIDPWSVMKTFFLFGVAAAIMGWVGTYVVWTVLDATGLFDAVNKAVKDVLSSPQDAASFDVKVYFSRELVLGVAAIMGAVNVVIFTALATLGSFLYNLASNMLGGLEVTLAED